MAVENHNANPIIVEPTASPDSGTPPRLLNPSLNTSSSSNSFESSRPQSRGSSATSASESSSPVPSHEPSNLRPQTPSDVEPLPPSATLTPNQSPRSRNLSATPLPKRAEEFDSAVQTGNEAWSAELAVSLGQTNIAFFARSSFEMDEVDTQAALWLSLHRVPVPRSQHRLSKYIHAGNRHHYDTRIGSVDVNIGLAKCKITSGRKTVTGQGILETHKPEDHHDLGQPRKRSRASLDQDSLVKDTVPFQSTNSSSATLTSGRRESPVSLKNRSSGENHKGLIELQINGNTKAFFKMETGELLHLTHWKRQHSNDSDSSSDSDNPNSIERKDVGETVSGASVLAKGRAAKDKWTEELQLDYEKWHDKHSHAKPQAGDCCAGLVTNKLPTGKPQII
ncbi:hypothetical protein HO133_009509 [Letharia lupina]|uniref:Uncharacterized protein n=1 Tax=Letharia lupina TaxID=560253 RepID=A0A8H6CL17_9LECA|nr:uncharacterized protein HO133_009509 [Letharia lupina]KAF6225509.1 hypothetical protein HO133_009509 [Letharia lupina]